MTSGAWARQFLGTVPRAVDFLPAPEKGFPINQAGFVNAPKASAKVLEWWRASALRARRQRPSLQWFRQASPPARLAAPEIARRGASIREKPRRAPPLRCGNKSRSTLPPLGNRQWAGWFQPAIPRGACARCQPAPQPVWPPREEGWRLRTKPEGWPQGWWRKGNRRDTALERGGCLHIFPDCAED